MTSIGEKKTTLLTRIFGRGLRGNDRLVSLIVASLGTKICEVEI